jgi:hypothetical protein
VAEAPAKPYDPPPDPALAAGHPLLAFVHIPRTGGGTVSSAVAKNYSTVKRPGNYQRGPEKTHQGLENIASKPGTWEALGDHVPYGLYLRYLPADTRYMTILRDPVDRVLSHYHFHAQAGDPPGSSGTRKLRGTWERLLNHERVERPGGDQEAEITLELDGDFSLEEGLRRKIVIYDNFMTRFLSGGESLFGELPPSALDRAKENVASFWFVGVRERLDDSIVLLGRKLQIGLMPYFLRHVSQKRPPLDETSDKLRAMIAEYNALDVELYRLARERFEAEAPSPSELAADVEELRERSVKVTEEAERERAAKKEANKGRRRAERAARATENRAGQGQGGRGGGGRTKAERRAACGPEAARRAGTGEGTGADKQAAGGESPRPRKPRTKGKAQRREQPAAD